jgi:hypothetical protein
MSNKVSIKDIKSKVKASNSDPIKFTFGLGENTIDVAFKLGMTLAEESVFIDRVCSNSFDVNGNYLPEYKNILFSVTVMQMLSNITIPKEKDDKGIEIIDMEEYKKWDSYFHFVETIYSTSTNYKDQCKFAGYIKHLEGMVNDKINYIKEQNFNKSKLDELFDTVNEEVKKFSSKFDGIDMKQFVEDLHKVAGMIGNVDNKTIVDEIVKVNQKTDKKDKIVNIADVKQ